MGERIRAFDWSKTPLGPVGELAPEPAQRRQHPPALEGADRALLGQGAGHALQRRLSARLRRQAPPRAGHCPPARPGARSGRRGLEVLFEGVLADRRGVLGERPAVLHRAVRIPGGDVLRRLLRPRAGRERAGWAASSASSARPPAGSSASGGSGRCGSSARGRPRARSRPRRRAGSPPRPSPTNPHDLPFALLYLLDGDGRTARRWPGDRARTGRAGQPAVDRRCHERGGPVAVPPAWRRRAGQSRSTRLAATGSGRCRAGRGRSRRSTAVVLPIVEAGPGRPRRVRWWRASARACPLRRALRGFLDLLAEPHRHRHRQRPRLRGGAEAGRGAGRAGPRQDRVLQQRQPRVPHAADPDARARSRTCWRRSHTDLPPAAAGQLEVVNRNGLRLLRLVNTLLDFSRIEAGRVRATYQPTDLAAFTAELASVFRAAVRAGRAAARSSIARRCPSRSSWTATCGRRSSSTSSPTPSSSPSRARSP